MSGPSPSPSAVVYRGEHEALLRRVERLEADGRAVPVTVADVEYLKDSLRAVRKDVKDLRDEVAELQAAEDRDRGAAQYRSTALAIIGALVGLAGVAVAIVSLATGGGG